MANLMDEELEAQTARIQEILERVQELLSTSDQPGALTQLQQGENSLPLGTEFEALRARIALEKEEILKGMNQNEIYRAIHDSYQNDDFENVLALEPRLFKSTTHPDSVVNRVNASRRIDWA